MFSHHSDQMFQWSKFPTIALWRCSLNVFVIVFVFVFVVCRCLFVGQVMFSHDPHQFCKVSVWSVRPEGFESNTMGESVNNQGRPRAARAAKKWQQQKQIQWQSNQWPQWVKIRPTTDLLTVSFPLRWLRLSIWDSDEWGEPHPFVHKYWLLLLTEKPFLGIIKLPFRMCRLSRKDFLSDFWGTF